MFIDKNSLQAKIPNGNYVNIGQYLVEVKYEFPKLFSDTSGRNLAGSMVSDFIGVFPKIICEFAPLTKTQLEEIVPILDSPRQIVKYYDPNKQQYVEMETYTGDYNISNRNIVDENTTNEGFDISFISVKKRT